MNIRSYKGVLPSFDKTVYVDSSAVLVGKIQIDSDSSIWPLVAARGDVNGAVNYQTGGALNVSSKANTLTSIICKRQSLPKKVTLRDFNDETPSLELT